MLVVGVWAAFSSWTLPDCLAEARTQKRIRIQNRITSSTRSNQALRNA